MVSPHDFVVSLPFRYGAAYIFSPRPLTMVRDKIKIILNGKEAEIEPGTTLTKLLEQMKIVPEMVACEVNQKIIKRSEYSSMAIDDGDEIEILQMIGGG